ncbi:hypothetical protein [Rathayibacter rathayi]|nr:hypothetical protein [Rathayibacter rathayi]PPF51982.1 hypothetical protein C5C08_01105 [Rathayibacter rathayi]PPF83589.1 hypothetical protein C5C14_01105 [Rathayibacter rathayi]PPG16144.1 hypothetical protein C5C11_00340 [Rathayibacter rathayi]PPG47408.1 hypothetical protein C5C20_01110 [Rathayibacter rathayi]PPI04973.1 hypothetical protein C5C43_01110 [Rathayibacter rathayi]
MSTDAPLPVGTEITITGSRIADIGNFSITGGAGEISSPSGTSRLVKLTQAIPAGATIELRSNLAMSKQFEMNARVSIPSGVELGSAAKVDAKITNTFLCTAS